MNNANSKPDYCPDQSLSAEELFYVRTILDDVDLEEELEASREISRRKLWLQFQTTASSLTHLYRERHHQGQYQGASSESFWTPFQSAAGSLTSFYKDANDEIRHTSEASRKTGYQRCRKDLMNWARGKRRYIRREELLAAIASVSVDNEYVAPGATFAASHTPPRPASPGSGAPRQQKRQHSSPTRDVHMDSPVWKKQRYN